MKTILFLFSIALFQLTTFDTNVHVNQKVLQKNIAIQSCSLSFQDINFDGEADTDIDFYKRIFHPYRSFSKFVTVFFAFSFLAAPVNYKNKKNASTLFKICVLRL